MFGVIFFMFWGLVKDTIGTSSLQGSISADGADWEHSHGDNEVGHQEHHNGLVEPSLTHDKSCKHIIGFIRVFGAAGGGKL